MKIATLLLILLSSCLYSAEPPVTAWKTSMEVPNGCLIKSIAFEDALNTYDGKAAMEAGKQLAANSNRWVKVAIVAFQVEGRAKWHAICFFGYNGGTWVYDPNYGSYQVSNKDPQLSTLEELASSWTPSVDILSVREISEPREVKTQISSTTTP